jgi:predicted ArsR family transcriptional regulator
MGRPPKHSPEEICRTIALHPEPVITAADVHEAMDMTQRGAQERLKRLVEDGYLESKKVGASGLVFWLTSKGRNTLGGD